MLAHVCAAEQEVPPLHAAVLQLPVLGSVVVAVGVAVPTLPCDAIETPVQAAALP